MQRYFINQGLSIDQIIEVPSELQKHWLKVMRAKIDDQAELVDYHHNVFLGQLVGNLDHPQIKIIRSLPNHSELPYRITIACGVPKKDKADLITMKATELGVDQIIFFDSAWSIAKWKSNKADKKLQRLQTIAQNAAQQSHRSVVPNIEYIQSLSEILSKPFDHKIVAYEEAAKKGEHSMFKQTMDQLVPGQSLLAIFGPEGGISPEEIDQMKQHQVVSVGLGPRILRTETAPLYFLAAISAFSELS